MFSDRVREHKEANATKGDASMAGCFRCLESFKKKFRFAHVTGRFPMSSDWVREHKETNETKGGAPMAWYLCCLKGE